MATLKCYTCKQPTARNGHCSNCASGGEKLASVRKLPVSRRTPVPGDGTRGGQSRKRRK